MRQVRSGFNMAIRSPGPASRQLGAGACSFWHSAAWPRRPLAHHRVRISPSSRPPARRQIPRLQSRHLNPKPPGSGLVAAGGQPPRLDPAVVGVYEAQLRVGEQDGDGGGQGGGLQRVVGVQGHDEGGLDPGDRGVARPGQARVLAQVNQGDLRAGLGVAKGRGLVVCGAVIDDDGVPVLEGLGMQAADALSQEATLVEARDDDGDLRAGLRGESSPGLDCERRRLLWALAGVNRRQRRSAHRRSSPPGWADDRAGTKPGR